MRCSFVPLLIPEAFNVNDFNTLYIFVYELFSSQEFDGNDKIKRQFSLDMIIFSSFSTVFLPVMGDVAITTLIVAVHAVYAESDVLPTANIWTRLCICSNIQHILLLCTRNSNTAFYRGYSLFFSLLMFHHSSASSFLFFLRFFFGKWLTNNQGPIVQNELVLWSNFSLPQIEKKLIQNLRSKNVCMKFHKFYDHFHKNSIETNRSWKAYVSSEQEPGAD